MQRFDSNIFHIIKHDGFEYLQLTLGYNYMANTEDEYLVEAFLVHNFVCVRTLTYTKWSYMWQWF